jgi:hypothetical protein
MPATSSPLFASASKFAEEQTVKKKVGCVVNVTFSYLKKFDSDTVSRSTNEATA